MKARQAAGVWRDLDNMFELTFTARRLDSGPLMGQHVIEVEPRPAVSATQIGALHAYATDRGLEISFGKSPRRVLTIA